MLEQGKLDRYGVKPVLTQEEIESKEAQVGLDHQLRTKGLRRHAYNPSSVVFFDIFC